MTVCPHLQVERLFATLATMIPHAEFERAIAQWKIRKQGGQVGTQAPEEASGAVVGEMASGEIGSGPTQGEPDPET